MEIFSAQFDVGQFDQSYFDKIFEVAIEKTLYIDQQRDYTLYLDQERGFSLYRE